MSPTLIIETMIDFVTWPRAPLQIYSDGTKRWPSDKVNHSFNNAFVRKYHFDFLAFLDIKHFGRL